jgi:hypothetical protein
MIQNLIQKSHDNCNLWLWRYPIIQPMDTGECPSVHNLQTDTTNNSGDFYIRTTNIWHSTLKHTKTLETHIFCRSNRRRERVQRRHTAPKWRKYTERERGWRPRVNILRVTKNGGNLNLDRPSSQKLQIQTDNASGIRRVRSLNVDTLRIYENCKPALYTVMIEVICCRHTGHRLPYCLLRSPHPAQYTAWPQGAITVLTSCSVQIQHMFFSSLSP